MSSFDVSYTLAAMISFVLGIGFTIIDGMLLWGILFFSIAILLVLMRIMWGVAGWADNFLRRI